MTEKQLLKFYLPRWERCYAKLWKKDGRNIVPQDGRVESERLDQVERCVIAIARAAGAKWTRKEDLRHAVNLIATGKSSSKRMSNAEINKVVAFMDLLIDPDNVNASMKLDHPEIAQRAALEAQLETLAPEYVAAISHDKFGKLNWHELSLQQLTQLAITLRHRSPVRVPQHALPKSRTIGRATVHQPV